MDRDAALEHKEWLGWLTETAGTARFGRLRICSRTNGRARQHSPPHRFEFYLAVAVIAVAMIMTPGPIFFLLLGRNMPEVPILVTTIFVLPLVVVADFIVVPDVVITVVRVIDAIVVMFTGGSCNRCRHRGGEET